MKSFTFGPEATEVVTDVTEVSGSGSKTVNAETTTKILELQNN